MLASDTEEIIGCVTAIERPRQPQEAVLRRVRPFQEHVRAPWTKKPNATDLALLKSAVQSEGSQSAMGSISAPSETRRLSRFAHLQVEVPTRMSPTCITKRSSWRLGEDATASTDRVSSTPQQSSEKETLQRLQPQPHKKPAAAAAVMDRLSFAAALPTRPGPHVLRGFRAPWLHEPVDIVDTGVAAPRGVADVLAVVALSLGPAASQSVPSKTRRLKPVVGSNPISSAVPTPSPRSVPSSPLSQPAKAAAGKTLERRTPVCSQ
jgi:hypothetical protein